MFLKKYFSLKNLILVSLLLIVGLLVALPSFTKKEAETHAPKTTTSKQTSTDQTAEVVPAREQVEEPKTSSQTKVQGNATQTPPPVSKPTPTETPITKTVTLDINTGSANYSYKVSWSEGMSVYQILDKAHTENKFSLKATWYSGTFNSYYVTEIHDKGCCWEYKVNGEKPPVGASVKVVNENDIITWKAT